MDQHASPHRSSRWSWRAHTATLLALLAFALLAARPLVVRAQDQPTDVNPFLISGNEVFGLQGALREAVGQPFGTFLVTEGDGRVFGLNGQNATIDQQIENFRRQGQAVRVWGTIFPAQGSSVAPQILVTSIVAAGPPVVQPTPTPIGRTTATVNVARANVRSGPSTAFPVVGTLDRGANCPATGRNGDATWLQLACPALAGWVSGDLLIVNGSAINLPVIPVGPPPVQPTPAPPAAAAWQAAYWANATLSGSPTVVRGENAIDFDWGFGSPAPQIPVDFFSARFERTANEPSGNYQISVTTDDGVRVWINDALVIDDWRAGSARTLTAVRTLGGATRYRIEYFEAEGSAVLRFNISRAQVQPPAPPQLSELPPQFNQWSAAYWNNRNLSGAPALVAFEPRDSAAVLDRNWGQGSPAPAIQVDNFSGRWVGIFQFAAGDYTFRARADDGVRVRINNITVIDAWHDGPKDVSNRFNALGAGNHTITVEFYENTGTAFVQISWRRENSGGGGGGGGNQWRPDE